MKLLSLLIRLVALCMLFAGALVASQKPIGASEILLISIALFAFADVVKSVGDSIGGNSSKKPTLPGSD